MHNINRRIARNTLFLYIRMFLVLAVTLYITRALLEALGVMDYGIYNVVCGFVSMFAFLNVCMSNAVQRFYNYELGKNGEEAMQRVYVTAIIIQLILVGIILLLTETLGLWYLYHKMIIPLDRFYAAKWIYQFSIFSFVFIIMQVPYSAAIMAYEKMDFYALVSILDVLLKLGIVIILKYIDYDKLILYGGLYAIISIIDFFLYFIYSKKKFPELKFKIAFHKNLFRPMLSFLGWNIFGTFAFTMKGQGLNVLLNAFFGPIVNAARGVSFQISNALLSFSSNIYIAFKPQLVQAYSTDNYSRVLNMTYSMSKITYYLLYMMVVPVVLEIHYILNLWLDGNVPKYTSIFTIIVIMNLLIDNFNTPLTQLVHATGKLKKYQLVASAINILVLPIAWLFIWTGSSPLFVFWVCLGVSIVNQCACLLVVRSIFPLRIRAYYTEVILPSFLVSITTPIFPIIIWLSMEPSFYRLLSVSVTSLISTIIFVYLLGINLKEKGMMKDMLTKILNKILKK